MTSVFNNVFSSEDLLFLQGMPIDTNTVLITDSVRSALTSIGMDLSVVTAVPMKWIQGDTAAHIDTGAPHTKTFLVYLNDSTGSLIIGDESHPIKTNTAFVFDEGVLHKTVGAGPRLLLGPMSERAEPVGAASALIYYKNEADAKSGMNSIGSSFTSYRISQIGGYSFWNIASNSIGSSPKRQYTVGETLDPGTEELRSSYRLYPTLGPEFVFKSPEIQAAATTVYQFKTAYDAAEVAKGSQQVYTFKTDWERMQYKLGTFGAFSRGL